jgi:hypothetical protein
MLKEFDESEEIRIGSSACCDVVACGLERAGCGSHWASGSGG